MSRVEKADGPVPPDGAAPRILPRVLITGTAILTVAAVAVILIFRFVGGERERALVNWQTRLGIVADSRKAAIENWLAAQRQEITSLADNASVRVYLARVLDAGGDGARAEAQYLRNLLVVTAARTGYDLPPAGPDVGAGVERVGRAGIAILNRRGRPVTRTGAMPPIDVRLRTFLTGIRSPGVRVYDLHASAAGEVAIGFVVPIFREQAVAGDRNVIGYVVALKPVARELFPLLRQPGATGETAEAILVRGRGAVIEYLSPLMNGALPLRHQMALNTPRLAAAAALERTGGFGIFLDYRGREVLSTSRAVEGVPWSLLYKIDRREALAATDARLGRLLVLLLLGTALTGAAGVGLWRHGASKRAADAARRAERAAARLQEQRDFLRLVTDNQPNAIYIVDHGDSLRFANAPGAERLNVDQGEIGGRSLTSVLGPDAARRYERLNRQALEDGGPVTELHRQGGNGRERVLQSKHVPFQGVGDLPGGVMIVEEDVTEAIVERERRVRNLRQIVDALLGAVDRRDPHAARHSVRVGMIGEAMAREMDLDERLVETARYAGELMNVGKIMVSEDILTKPGSLTETEMKLVQDALGGSAALLDGIEFDGPVVETLQQVRERWNGTGPGGLRGDAILVTARIVAVANSFVAMTSARAHRDGMAVDDAVGRLLEEAGERFDRRALAALIGYLENRGGRAQLEDGAAAS